MSINANSKGKLIINEVLKESSLNLGLSNIKNVDYILDENIGLKIVARDRKEQIDFKDSIYEKSEKIRSFEDSCKENGLEPFYCAVQILKNHVNIFIFDLESARKSITKSGLNINIKNEDIGQNKCMYDGALWRYSLKSDLFESDRLIKESMVLIYSGEDELKSKINQSGKCATNETETNPEEAEMTIKIADEFKEIEEELKNLPKYRTALAKQRIGQGSWRDLLIKKYGCKCALCDINMKELLIASHIKEFSECNEENGEQLDTQNGLILCANHDKLFDSHLISFDENGKIIISDKISRKSYESLCINESLEISPELFNDEYMNYHRHKLQSK